MSAAQLALAIRDRIERGDDATLVDSEPIALIGIGCRFPGGCDDADALWTFVRNRGDAVTEVPRERFDVDACYEPTGKVPATVATRYASFVRDIDRFDATFFGISPREAARMDPQHRMLLEVAWEALEDGGQLPERLAGSATGVFVALCNHDYLRAEYADPERVVAHTTTGTQAAVGAGRLAFLMDLRGPAITVDTACSSSLLAVHLACRSLRGRETDLAIAGGSGLMLGPEVFMSLSQWGLLAPDGRCKTFDARADGFGRSEGCGIVVLKRLADALADGDRVHAVIRGTATNQDGRSAAMTAPSGPAQQALIRAALRNGRVEPRDIGYVEAHGTGTALGDPIEVEALDEVLGRGADAGPPCAIASVKANIGHLEGVAGVAGLIKASLVLEREEIPPQALFERLSPHLDLEGSRLYVPTAPTPWRRGGGARFASVSSFGLSGTNVHVVVEEAPQHVPTEPGAAAATKLLVLSARDPGALAALAGRHADRLARADAGAAIDDVCYTAATRRTHHEHRFAATASELPQLVDALRAFAAGEVATGCATGVVPRGARPAPVWVFSGQGAQWAGMGLDLLESDPVFRRTVDACDAAMRDLLGRSVVDALRAPPERSPLAETRMAQPAIFALQVGLAEVWRSWGLAPAMVVGHSVGEIAAAHVAGALSLEAAARLVATRGLLMQEATGHGRMLSVEAAPEAIAPLLDGLEGALSIAAVNAPESCVLSGSIEAIAEAERRVSASSLSSTRLPVDYAFHSPQMEAFRPRLEAALSGLRPGRCAVPMISTVTGSPVSGETLDAAYWGRNMREPVRFRDAVEAALERGATAFLEIAPHGVLSTAIRGTASGGATAVVASMRRGRDAGATMRLALGQLWVAGERPDWEAFHDGAGRVVDLPAYPWRDERYPVPLGVAARRPPAASGAHPLLGRALPVATSARIHEGVLDATRTPFLADHRFSGEVVVPATAMLEMALAACAGDGRDAMPVAVESFEFERMLRLGDRGTAVQTVLEPQGGGRAAVSVHSLGDDGRTWIRHAAGSLGATPRAVAEAPPARGGPVLREWDGERLEARIARLGAEFGPAFRSLREVRVGDGWASATVRAVDAISGELDRYRFHPALLDACMQAIAVAAAPDDDGDEARALVPVACGRYAWHGAPTATLRVELRVAATDGADRIADLWIAGDDGRAVATLTALRVRPVPRARLVREEVASRLAASAPLFRTRWMPATDGPAAPGAAIERWRILDDGSGVAGPLARALEARGATVVRIEPADTALPADRDDAGRLGVVVLAAVRCPTDVADDPAALPGAVADAAMRLARGHAVASAHPGSRLVLVTRGGQALPMPGEAADPVQAALWGARNAIAIESPELAAVAVDLDPGAEPGDCTALAELLGGLPLEDRIALRGDRRWAARLVPLDPPVPGDRAGGGAERLRVPPSHRLDDLGFEVGPRRVPGAGEVEVRVRAVGLNFRDVLKVLGTYPEPDTALGDEFAGTVVAVGPGVEDLSVGDEVMGVMVGCLGEYATGPAGALVRRPATMSAEEAAAVPVAYLTAVLALEQAARLRPGERVLVHAGTGGVGSAAVRLALSMGAEVYATAGTPDKRSALLGLGVRGAFDSRSLGFRDALLAATGGEGVDVVLNSLAGDFIPASFAVLRRGGRFVEIGRTGTWSDEQVAALGRGIAYTRLFLARDLEARPRALGAVLQSVVDRIGRGELGLPPIDALPVSAAVPAFRHMAQGRHVGKLVLRFEAVPAPSVVRADATYLVTGGSGGLGLAAAEALAGQGARSLVLLGRSAPGADAAARIEALRAGGVEVAIVMADVASPDLGARLEPVLEPLPPLRGVVHAAGRLDDAPVGALDRDSWLGVMDAKVSGLLNLVRLATGRPVEFVLCYSAGAALLGSPGQSNYAAANACMDAIVERLRRTGRPCASVQWGPWARVGMTARMSARARARLAARGLDEIDATAGASALAALLGGAVPTVAVVPARWRTYADGLPAQARAFVSALVAPTAGVAPSVREEAATDARDVLAALPARARRAWLLERLAALARRALEFPAGRELPEDGALRDFGLDSLMAIELRNAIVAMWGAPLPATLLFDFPTLDALAGHLAGRLGPPGATSAPDSDEAVAAMSDDEAEALLMKELDDDAAATRG